MRELNRLRDEIDALNAEIITLFAKRLELTRKIAEVKKQEALPVDDFKREEEQKRLLHSLALKYGIKPAVIEEIFSLFVDYSKMEMRNSMEKK